MVSWLFTRIGQLTGNRVKMVINHLVISDKSLVIDESIVDCYIRKLDRNLNLQKKKDKEREKERGSIRVPGRKENRLFPLR